MAYGGRHRRRRNALDSIHDPPDPSPRTLPEEARGEWGEAYRDAMKVYRKDDLAARAAWRKVTLRWKQTGKKTWSRCKNGVCYWPETFDIPDPQMELVGLGVLVEYVFIDQRGKMHVREMDPDHPPILWWDDEIKALYAFPKQKYPECRYTEDFVSERAKKVFEKWTQRPPECFDAVGMPDVVVKPVGAADSLSYASDKWNDPNPDPALRSAQQYIHEHWYDVWVWQDTRAGVEPNAIFITGGELDLHERGLIH